MNYSQEGMYYVTECVNDRNSCPFGKIVDAEMSLSQIGEIVKECWEEVPKRFGNIILDQYLIMPNHMHAILFIEGGVGAIHESPLRGSPKHMSIIERRRMMLPKVMGWHKMNSAKRINELLGTQGSQFWQRGYYEHIIRDGADLDRIREYILENPANWEGDEDFPSNIRMGPIHRDRQGWSGVD